MASDRVINVPLGTPGPDDSGVGKMLFRHFEEDRKNKMDAAQLDVTEGIRAKYRREEQAQGNVFNEGLTKLRAFLNQQTTDIAFQREQEARGQAARHLEGMIGTAANQGIDMPNQATPSMGTPEAGIAGPQVANPIEPGALEVAKDQFGRSMNLHFKKLEQQSGNAMDAEKKLLFEQLDRVDDSTAMEARDWLNRFTALEADPRLLAQIEGYTTPGKGSKMDWQQVKTKIIPEEMKLTSQAATKMALAREITARQKSIAELKTAVARSLANSKMDATQFKNLASLHQELGRQAKELMGRHAAILEAIYAESNPAKQGALNNQAAVLRQMAEDVQQQQGQVTQRMATWQGGPPTGQPSGPTLAPGGFGSIDKPGDPLGIKR